MHRVCDLGEFRFLAEVVSPSLGLDGTIPEDAAVITEGSRDLVITVDRGNRPLAFLLGEEDWKVYGWLLVTATLSDLAAVGAKPVAFSNSIELPSEFEVVHAREFFKGIRSACASFGVPLAGGNVAHASAFSAHGFAVGEVEQGFAIRRAGCEPGDALVLIGEGGLFMSAFLNADLIGLQSLDVRQRRSLTQPQPKLAVMRSLAEKRLVKAASDDSDGVLGAIWNVASASGVAADLLEDKITWPLHALHAAELADVDVRAIFFAWGDWQIVAAVRLVDLAEVEEVCRAHKISMFQLGQAVEGPPRITWVTGGQRQQLNVVRNEAFTSSAYLGTGQGPIWEYLRKPLVADS